MPLVRTLALGALLFATMSDALSPNLRKSKPTAGAGGKPCLRKKSQMQLDPFDCYTEDGKDYVGLQDMSMSGRKCANWMDKSEDSGIATTTKGMGNHNYCRNPDASMDKPWCFTIDPAKDKEECSVPKCKDGGEPPEKWIAPAGSKSTDEPCTYEVPEKEPRVWKEGVACTDRKGDKQWLIGLKMYEGADPKACMEKCEQVAGTEYYTHFSTANDDGKNCGCYRECIPRPEDLTINGPTTFRVF
jgi:hypothetical protein